MPSQKRKDDDLVPKDKPERPAKRAKDRQRQEPLIELPTPNSLPEWDPLVIDNDIDRGKPRLPFGTDKACPIELFRLFFNEEWLKTIVQCTNANALRIQEEDTEKDFRCTRAWHPVNKFDIMRYLAGVIHMGLHPEAEISDYWGTYEDTGVMHRIREFISLERWQQIDRFLYCEELRAGTTRPFERVWAFSRHIQEVSYQYWTPGKNLAVDESMQLFTGRAKEITTIPCKRHATGYKIWMLADHGYIMRFLFHAEGDGKYDGPYRINPRWKQEGFSATEAVVLDLAAAAQLEPFKHVIWLDNLFTKIRLLEGLRQLNIGGAGTVRPPSNQTPREERVEKKKKKQEAKRERVAQREAAKQRKIEQKEAAKMERERKKQAKQQTAKGRIVKEGQLPANLPATPPCSAPFFEPAPTAEHIPLFGSDMLPDAETLEDLLPPFPTVLDPTLEDMLPPFPTMLDPTLSQELGDTELVDKENDEGDPETNEPFNEQLAKLRSHINHIEWGTKWFAVSKNKTVAQMAWRDNNVVLFATTVSDPTAVVVRPRKRPGATRTGAVKTRKAFGEMIIKDMDIPVLIDQYNHHMGAVDQFDQLRSYYDTLRSHRKTWRPLFSLLLEIVLINSFKLSTFSDRTEAKQSGHRRFRLQLVKQLEEIAGKATRFDSHTRSINDLQVQNGLVHQQGTLCKQAVACVMCKAKGRRLPLEGVHPNVRPASASKRVRGVRRTVKGCIQCNLALCDDCCKEHLQAANSSADADSEVLTD